MAEDRVNRIRFVMRAPAALVFFALCISLLWLACDSNKNMDAAKPAAQPAPLSADNSPPKLSLPPDTGPSPQFDSERAMKYVKEIVAYGPRPIGSTNHKKVEEYIASRLKGDT